MSARWFPLALAALMAAACGGGGGGAPAPQEPNAGTPPAPAPQEPPEDPAVCSVSGQRLSVRGFMEDQYFWHDRMGTPDTAATSMDAYFRSLLYKPLDRYSYTESTASFDELFNQGTRTGYGYTLVWADAAQTQLRVRSVEPLSPVGQAGLRRGDQVLAIDGYTPAQIAQGLPRPVSQPGVSRTFRLQGADGTERSLTVQSAQYPLSPVQASAVLDASRAGSPVKVGYVAYHQFVGYSRNALAQAFRSFYFAGVQELVVDLRYNGGGSVTVARDLASMIGGARTSDKLFTYLRFNSKHPENNQSIPFTTAESLNAFSLPNLSRVIVLTSRDTASASELVINGLRPFMEVVLVGDTTFGKPYGFAPRDYCGITYNAVNFESLNAVGEGRFTAGLPAQCPASDDLSRPLGDPQEGRLRAALSYIANGRCEAAAPQSAAMPTRPSPVFGEAVAPRMFVE